MLRDLHGSIRSSGKLSVAESLVMTSVRDMQLSDRTVRQLSPESQDSQLAEDPGVSDDMMNSLMRASRKSVQLSSIGLSSANSPSFRRQQELKSGRVARARTRAGCRKELKQRL